MKRLPILQVCTFAVLATLVTLSHAQIAIRLDVLKYLHEGNADEFLKPGDIMLKRINESSPATTFGISVSQTFISSLYGTLGSGEADAGDPQVVHAAIYLGGGQTAEAHGSTPGENAGVGLRRLSKHAGFVWYVYRPIDAAHGAEAAAIAKTWATGRMGYALPLNVPFSDSDFGAKARSEAFEYGRFAQAAGGPPGRSEMFCSQFVLAAYQAAWVVRLLKANPTLTPDQVTMQHGVDRHASNTSPLVMHGHLAMLIRGRYFDPVGFVVTQLPPQLDATPKLPLAGGGVMTFKGVSGRCFNSRMNPGSAITLWECLNTDNQRWRLKDGRMVNEMTKWCLSLDSGRIELNNRLIVWDCHGGPDQQWTYKDGMFQLGNTGYCADAGAGGHDVIVRLGKCIKAPGTTWGRDS